MAVIELQPNLYTRGSLGTFEDGEIADFGYITAGFNLSKSTEQFFSGSHSIKSVVVGDYSGGQYQLLLQEDGILIDPYLMAGRTYILKAKVYLPEGVGINPPGTDGCKIILTGLLGGAGYSTILRTDLTIASDIKNSWRDVSFKFLVNTSGDFNFNFVLGVGSSWASSGTVNVGGVIYYDKVELLEYIDEDELDIDTEFGRNPIPISITSSHIVTNTTAVKYELTLYLRSLIADSFEEIITTKGFPPLENDGPFTWNIQKPLLAYLLPTLPTYNQSTITFASKCIRRFYAAIKEYGSTPFVTNELKRITLTDVTDVLHGGLSFIDWPGNSFFSDNIALQGQFLTWAPNNKRVAPDQQEYLYFMTNQQDYSTLYLHCKVTFDDGTTETFTPLTKPGSANKICILPVGYAQLGLGSLDPTKVIKKFTVWVNKSADPASIVKKSQERTFIIDWDYHKYTRYFLYQNSLGAMEVIRCLGKFETGIDVNTQEGSTILPPDYSASDSENFNYNTSYQATIKGNTGILSTVWKEYLTEFIISEHRYELVKGNFIKIRLTKDKADLLKDFEYLNALSFDYTYAHSNPAYSNY